MHRTCDAHAAVEEVEAGEHVLDAPGRHAHVGRAGRDVLHHLDDLHLHDGVLAIDEMGSARRARTNAGAGVGLGTKQAALDGRCGMRAEWEGTGTHHRLSAHQPRSAPPRPRVRSHLEPCRERQRKRGQWERRRDASRAASARCDGSMASAAVRRAARTHQCQKRRLRKAEWISFTAHGHAKPHGFVEKFGFVRADPLRYQSYRLQCGLARGHFVGYFGGHNREYA